MNKGELVEQIVERTGATKKETEAILTAMLESIMEAVSSGDKVTLVGFGAFEPRHRQERQGRNPQTGKELTIPATTIPAFSAGRVFKQKVAA